MILLYHFWVFTQRNESQHTIEICMQIFITALFTINKLWNQIMPYAGKQMELEIIISEITQTQKD
jgi:hypothetical protein